MKHKKSRLVMAISIAVATSSLYAADSQLSFSNTFSLSDAQSPDLGKAFKAKLVRLGNGALISVFGDGADSTKMVYDLKGDVERPARDIFIRTCPTASVDCSVEENWSEPENVSGTAALSSMTTDWQGDNGDPSAYWGDSDKPNISNGGSNIMITWTDKYCDALAGDIDGTNQRSVSYLTRDNREIPFSCTWAKHATVGADGTITWGSAAEQLSDASRDAKQDVSKVNAFGKAVVSWQEDPLGLQIGNADGPGDGASGATASHGTDIWFTTATNVNTKFDSLNVPVAGKTTGFTNVARLTDNAIKTASGNHGVIKDAGGLEILDADIDGGQAAATRANTALVGPTIVVAYEETKGSEGLAIGKFVRYHSFPYTLDPGAAANQIGCIISNPLENARRVRFMPQASNLIAADDAAITDAGLRMGIIWKEGQFDQGGPSDIMVRMAFDGVSATNMTPAVDAACATSDYLVAEDLNNTAAMNLSSNTPVATNDNLADTTSANNIENALAHRGAIVGNDLYVGYSYTNDWALSTYTNLENYDFWLRRYDAATKAWTLPKNISNLPTKEITVREPRIVKTPYTTSTAFGTYNPDALVIAWGLQTNVATHIEQAEELDILYTRTFDKGETFEPVVTIENANLNSRFESQLRPTPDNEIVYAVWNESDGTSTNAVAAVGTSIAAIVEVVSSSDSGAFNLFYLMILGVLVAGIRALKSSK